MPISSAEIAQAAMQNYQQMALMNQAFNQSDLAAGYALNAASSLGSGAIGALRSLPTMMGIGAGMSSLAGGAGLGTAAMAGLGAASAWALPVAAVAGAGAFVGGQMMEGAQQQQYLNATLASSFNFSNKVGGRGFTRADTSMIGSSMRALSEQFGPSGEITSMKELSDLAGQMGRTTMGRGVRDAQEFNQKFRDLVKTVKTVATELNTSLGSAMEFMTASRASGMFTQQDQARFARVANQTALGSNLALSEVTAMASTGSQIARAYGGLGKQGAMGGMRAIGQIGAAVSTGVLSEEDIYNATGQTGAEGRQAMAATMMQQTGEFLKSGKGRYFLASMAGKGGTIDEAAAEKYMMGMVGVGESRQMAGKHLMGVGRADFIRNEGRLRGAVMEKFGVMAPALALQGWASQRGIDINTMDDRAMLFAQRQLGMGRDEMDAAVKMAQDLPKILREQTQKQDQAAYGAQVAKEMKMQGIEGVKRRFEMAKEKLTAGLKRAGADIYDDLTNMVDRWLGGYMGTVIDETTTGLSDIWSDIMSKAGTSGATRQMKAVFGGGAASAGMKALSAKLEAGGITGPAQGKTGMSYEDVMGTPDRDRAMFGVAGAWFTKNILGKGEVGDRMRMGGYGAELERIGGMDSSRRDTAVQELMTRASKNQRALSGSIRSVRMEEPGLRDIFLKEYNSGPLGTAGADDVVAETRKLLQRESEKGSAEAGRLVAELDSIKNPEDKLKWAAGQQKALGLEGSKTLVESHGRMGTFDTLTRIKKGETQRDYSMRMGLGMLQGGSDEQRAEGEGNWVAGFWGVQHKARMRETGSWLLGAVEYISGASAERKAQSLELEAFSKSKAGLELAEGIFAGDTSAIEKARQMQYAGKSETASDAQKMQGLYAADMLLMSEYRNATTTEQKEAIRKQWEENNKENREGGSVTDMENSFAYYAKNLQAKQDANRAKQSKELQNSSEARAKRLESTGVLTYDKTKGEYNLSAETAKTVGKMGAEAASIAGLTMAGLEMGRTGDLDKAYEIESTRLSQFANLSVEKQKALASAMGDQNLAVFAKTSESFRSQIRKEGVGATIGRAFGAQDSKGLRAAFAKGDDAYLQALTSELGLGEEASAKLSEKGGALRKLVEDMRKTGGRGEADPGKMQRALEEAKSDPTVRAALEKKKEEGKDPSLKALEAMAKGQNTTNQLLTVLASAQPNISVVVNKDGSTNVTSKAEGGPSASVPAA